MVCYNLQYLYPKSWLPHVSFMLLLLLQKCAHFFISGRRHRGLVDSLPFCYYLLLLLVRMHFNWHLMLLKQLNGYCCWDGVGRVYNWINFLFNFERGTQYLENCAYVERLISFGHF